MSFDSQFLLPAKHKWTIGIVVLRNSWCGFEEQQVHTSRGSLVKKKMTRNLSENTFSTVMMMMLIIKKNNNNNRSPSEWHHLTQQVKTRKSWRSGALHMVGCSVQLRCADGRSCRDSRLGCCCCCCCCGCCCCRFLLTVPLGPLVDEKGRAQKAGTPPQPPPPTHPPSASAQPRPLG